jgi:hypothetical protein
VKRNATGGRCIWICTCRLVVLSAVFLAPRHIHIFLPMFERCETRSDRRMGTLRLTSSSACRTALFGVWGSISRPFFFVLLKIGLGSLHVQEMGGMFSKTCAFETRSNMYEMMPNVVLDGSIHMLLCAWLASSSWETTERLGFGTGLLH